MPNNPTKTRQPDLFRTEQSALNRSYDDELDVLALEGLVDDPAEATASRLKRKGVFGNVGYVKFDADDTAPVYIGLNTDPDAADADTDWTIYKFTYVAEAATAIRRKTGAWSNRASLFS